MKTKEQKTSVEKSNVEQKIAATKQATKKLKARKDSHTEAVKNFLAPGRKIKKK